MSGVGGESRQGRKNGNESGDGFEKGKQDGRNKVGGSCSGEGSRREERRGLRAEGRRADTIRSSERRSSMV